jgi:tripartite-type tricarboxylate transporter receptor subunit TctC
MRLRSLLLIICIVMTLPGAARSGEYPDRPIKVVAPFAAGGGGDIVARLVLEGLRKRLGQPVIIENRPGANGVAAAQAVRTAEPDGYTLLLLGNIHAIGQSLMKSSAFDVGNSFTPVATIAFTDVVVVTSPKSPLSSLTDLLAKANATPDGINIGTGLVGTTQHLTAELFKSVTKVHATIVNFRSSGDLVSAITRGDVEVGFELLPAVTALLESGALKSIAVSADRRLPRLPQALTFEESGVHTSVTSWAILAAPAHTPERVIDRLNQAVTDVLVDRDLRQKFEQMGYRVGGGTPEDAKTLLVGEIARWKGVIKDAKLDRL